MQKAGEFLGTVVRRMKRPEAPLAWLSASWPSIVGKALATRTRPVRCEGGRLEVAADGKAWQIQLETMTLEFCARINEAWGGNLVREVKFSAAKPSPKRLPYELDNEHTPFIRRSEKRK